MDRDKNFNSLNTIDESQFNRSNYLEYLNTSKDVDCKYGKLEYIIRPIILQIVNDVVGNVDEIKQISSTTNDCLINYQNYSYNDSMFKCDEFGVQSFFNDFKIYNKLMPLNKLDYLNKLSPLSKNVDSNSQKLISESLTEAFDNIYEDYYMILCETLLDEILDNHINIMHELENTQQENYETINYINNIILDVIDKAITHREIDSNLQIFNYLSIPISNTCINESKNEIQPSNKTDFFPLNDIFLNNESYISNNYLKYNKLKNINGNYLQKKIVSYYNCEMLQNDKSITNYIITPKNRVNKPGFKYKSIYYYENKIIDDLIENDNKIWSPCSVLIEQFVSKMTLPLNHNEYYISNKKKIHKNTARKSCNLNKTNNLQLNSNNELTLKSQFNNNIVKNDMNFNNSIITNHLSQINLENSPRMISINQSLMETNDCENFNNFLSRFNINENLYKMSIYQPCVKLIKLNLKTIDSLLDYILYSRNSCKNNILEEDLEINTLVSENFSKSIKRKNEDLTIYNHKKMKHNQDKEILERPIISESKSLTKISTSNDEKIHLNYSKKKKVSDFNTYIAASCDADINNKIIINVKESVSEKINDSQILNQVSLNLKTELNSKEYIWESENTKTNIDSKSFTKSHISLNYKMKMQNSENIDCINTTIQPNNFNASNVHIKSQPDSKHKTTMNTNKNNDRLTLKNIQSNIKLETQIQLEHKETLTNKFSKQSKIITNYTKNINSESKWNLTQDKNISSIQANIIKSNAFIKSQTLNSKKLSLNSKRPVKSIKKICKMTQQDLQLGKVNILEQIESSIRKEGFYKWGDLSKPIEGDVDMQIALDKIKLNKAVPTLTVIKPIKPLINNKITDDAVKINPPSLLINKSFDKKSNLLSTNMSQTIDVPWVRADLNKDPLGLESNLMDEHLMDNLPFNETLINRSSNNINGKILPLINQQHISSLNSFNDSLMLTNVLPFTTISSNIDLHTVITRPSIKSPVAHGIISGTNIGQPIIMNDKLINNEIRLNQTLANSQNCLDNEKFIRDEWYKNYWASNKLYQHPQLTQFSLLYQQCQNTLKTGICKTLIASLNKTDVNLKNFKTFTLVEKLYCLSNSNIIEHLFSSISLQDSISFLKSILQELDLNRFKNGFKMDNENENNLKLSSNHDRPRIAIPNYAEFHCNKLTSNQNLLEDISRTVALNNSILKSINSLHNDIGEKSKINIVQLSNIYKEMNEGKTPSVCNKIDPIDSLINNYSVENSSYTNDNNCMKFDTSKVSELKPSLLMTNDSMNPVIETQVEILTSIEKQISMLELIINIHRDLLGIEENDDTTFLKIGPRTPEYHQPYTPPFSEPNEDISLSKDEAIEFARKNLMQFHKSGQVNVHQFKCIMGKIVAKIKKTSARINEKKISKLVFKYVYNITTDIN